MALSTLSDAVFARAGAQHLEILQLVKDVHAFQQKNRPHATKLKEHPAITPPKSSNGGAIADDGTAAAVALFGTMDLSRLDRKIDGAKEKERRHQDALDQVQGFAPDFILLDVMMPGMDGPKTLELLGQLVNTEQIPVAFMTAKVQPDEVAHYRSLGAHGVIIKPFDPMLLAAQVRDIWNQRHG